MECSDWLKPEIRSSDWLRQGGYSKYIWWLLKIDLLLRPSVPKFWAFYPVCLKTCCVWEKSRTISAKMPNCFAQKSTLLGTNIPSIYGTKTFGVFVPSVQCEGLGQMSPMFGPKGQTVFDKMPNHLIVTWAIFPNGWDICPLWPVWKFSHGQIGPKVSTVWDKRPNHLWYQNVRVFCPVCLV